MYAALFTTKLDDEPISLYSDNLCGGCIYVVITFVLLGHIKRCRTAGCSFAGCEQIGTGSFKVIVEPIEGVVVLACPHPAQTLKTLTDGLTVAQVTFLSVITFSLTWIWGLGC